MSFRDFTSSLLQIIDLGNLIVPSLMYLYDEAASTLTTAGFNKMERELCGYGDASFDPEEVCNAAPRVWFAFPTSFPV